MLSSVLGPLVSVPGTTNGPQLEAPAWCWISIWTLDSLQLPASNWTKFDAVGAPPLSTGFLHHRTAFGHNILPDPCNTTKGRSQLDCHLDSLPEPGTAVLVGRCESVSIVALPSRVSRNRHRHLHSSDIVPRPSPASLQTQTPPPSLHRPRRRAQAAQWQSDHVTSPERSRSGRPQPGHNHQHLMCMLG